MGRDYLLKRELEGLRDEGENKQNKGNPAEDLALWVQGNCKVTGGRVFESEKTEKGGPEEPCQGFRDEILKKAEQKKEDRKKTQKVSTLK